MPTNGNADIDQLEKRFVELESTAMCLSNRLDEEQLRVSTLSKQVEDKDREILAMIASANNNLEKELAERFDKLLDASIEKIMISMPKPSLRNKTLEERVEYLEQISKVNTLKSCSEYASYGVDRSGMYQIDPDGELNGHPPIDVFCDFEEGSTNVFHDHMFAVEIDHCPGPMCYQLDLDYLVQRDQIDALIQNSESCSQDISFNCVDAALSANGDPIGVWLNRNGMEETYFVGANHGDHICTCGLDETCSDSDHGRTCNCDATEIPEIQNDHGTITNATALPITGFRYGELEYDMQEASIYISELKCKDIPFNGSPRFIASKNSPTGNIPSGIITFDRKPIDNTNSFDETTGIFKAPVQGSYVFFVNAYVKGKDFNKGTDSRIYVYVNGADVMEFNDDEDAGYHRQLNFFFEYSLKKNDELWLHNYFEDAIFVRNGLPLTFLGYLM